jgi:hypothetical protein
VVVSARKRDVEALRDLAGELPLREIGRVGGDAIVLDGAGLPLDEATAIWEAALPAAVGEAGA